MSEVGRTRTLDRLLGLAGAVGGLLWAAIPVSAAVAFVGVEAGGLDLGALAAVGALFRFAGLSVVALLAGAIGLYRHAVDWPAGPGRPAAAVVIVGIVLLLPGSTVPSGWLPEHVSALVPPVFFAGLALIAAGSLLVGVVGWRTGGLPAWHAAWFGAAMPVGAVAGGSIALAGGGTLALVLGLLAPYGLAWVGLGSYLARTA